jgi:hypothetical protein
MKMKSILKILAIAGGLTIVSYAQTAQTSGPTDAQKSFNTLKSLEGDWSGKNSEGMPLKVSFHATAADSAIMSEIHGHGTEREDMISMIHMDGPDRLLLTHYCSIGNQPRLQAAVSPDGKTFTFNFADATNLKSADDGHMTRVVIAMLDADHHTEEWIFTDHGKQMKEYFDLRRSL